MEKGKLGVMVETKFQQNPVQVVQAKLKELEIGFKSWLIKQSLPIEAAVVTLTSDAQGAVIGAIMGNITNDISSNIPTPPPPANLSPQVMASLQQAQALGGGPLIQAHNFAVMTGVNAGLSCVMKRVRGKEDVQSRSPFFSSTFSLPLSSSFIYILVSAVPGNLSLGALCFCFCFALRNQLFFSFFH